MAVAVVELKRKVVLERVPVAPVREAATLARALSDLGIGVYPLGQVRAFQRRVAWESRAVFAAMTLLFCFVVAAVAWALAAVALQQGAWGIDSTAVFLRSELRVLLSALAGVEVCGGVFLLGGLLRENRGALRWKVRNYDRGEIAVPRGARETARRIRERLPFAAFEVHSFQKDPFLFVRWEGQEYCVAHWDEQFEDR